MLNGVKSLLKRKHQNTLNVLLLLSRAIWPRFQRSWHMVFVNTVG
ncbi:hypothetical protein NEOC65_001894 [Neochlamydia sp. AcF65]|nr:hypothetical protein [Neochlamydia sp. AcF65]